MSYSKNAKRESKTTAAPTLGKDDMRLLEFAIASATTKVDRQTHELVFTDLVKNPATREDVERVVRIVFSPKYGRPTSQDDDVLVALLTLSHMAGFASPKVHYTSEQVCEILGWAKGGSQYRMIDDAFRRWLGVRIYADNFYFDSKTGLMADRQFGIIDDRERQRADRYQALRRSGHTGDAVRSWFQWSPVMQETFEAGMVRSLDLDFFRSIENGLARKLYRYLSMYFWRDRSQQFELASLTHQKLGMRQVKNSAELKRRLKPAVLELEELGFLLPDGERYSKLGKSVWVNFTAASKKQKAKAKGVSPLEAELVEIGVNAKSASRFVQRLTPERVKEDIDHAKLLDKRGEIRASLPGFLFKLLDAPEPWPRPKGFKTVAERKIVKAKAASVEAEKRQAEESRRQAEIKEQSRVDDYLEKVRREGQLEAFEEQALRENKFAREAYFQAKKSGGDAHVYLQSAVKALVEKRLAEEAKEKMASMSNTSA